MSTAPERDYETFELYLNLPQELRMMIIDRMEPGDRCRFSRCSKLCNKEAKASKNYIFSLKLSDCFADLLEIEVNYGDGEKDYGYHLKFCEYKEKKFIEYRRMVLGRRIPKGLWRIDLDYSVNLAQLATEHFVKLLGMYQNTIKRLEIGRMMEENICDHKNVDFGIERLNSLKVLSVTTNADISQFVSKIRQTLNILIVYNEENIRKIADWEEIYNIQETLFMPHLKLNNQQFLRLTAHNVEIHMGELTEQDICTFIRSWQNGTLGKTWRSYTLHLDNSNFDIKRLLKLLGAPHHNLREKDFKIKSYDQAGIVATLHCTPENEPLLFVAGYPEGYDDFGEEEEGEEESDSDEEMEEEDQ